MSFDPMQGKGQEVAHIDDDLPYAFNWTLSPDGLTLAIAKANKLDIRVQPEIRLLTLKDGKERRIALKDWSSINSLDWTADGKGLWVSASNTTGINAMLNVDLQVGHDHLGTDQDGCGLGDSFARWTLSRDVASQR